MMEWNIKSVEEVEKINNFNKDLSTFHTRKAFLSNYLKPTKDRANHKILWTSLY